MSADEFKRQMAALMADYRASLPPRLDTIDALWGTLLASGEAGPEADPMQALLRELHTIAGSARTFGLPELSAAARKAELYFDPYCTAGTLPEQAEREAFLELLAELRRQVLAG